MIDRRGLPGLAAGLSGLAFATGAAVLASPPLAVVAGVCSLAAGAASLSLLRRVRTAERQASEAASEILTLRNLELIARSRAKTVWDSDTGLPDARFFEVALQGRVAAARRTLSPATLVLLDLGIDHSGSARQAALGVFAEVLRRTVREADVACRIGERTFALVLEDTTEEGGVWAAERLQIALAKEGPRLGRLAAGVATYPSHGLRAEEVLARAQGALRRACAAGSARGLGQVEVAPADPG